MNYYLNKFALRKQLIPNDVPSNLGIVVVIPCHNEPNLISSLQSLYNCVAPSCSVEVIVVINASEKADPTILDQNKRTLAECKGWYQKQNNTKIRGHFIDENSLPEKHAGVGLARKIGMDEAVRRFELINNPNGILLCFDADSQCLSNYLTEVEKHFLAHPETPACSIYFEHPIIGDQFSERNYEGIAQYELHLRYYKNGLAYCGLPYAYHTVGSSMAVRSNAYQKQNGMNKRKAGEDFYFLQKLIPLGNFTVINTTKVIPSPRVSDRVPFGTGKAMENWMDGDQKELLSYHPTSFMDLKQFCDIVPSLYDKEEIKMPIVVKSFLATISFEDQLLKIKTNSTSKQHFIQLFYNWFNAFKVLKYMHFARDYYYGDISVIEGANQLLVMLGIKEEPDIVSLLYEYRKIDKARCI